MILEKCLPQESSQHISHYSHVGSHPNHSILAGNNSNKQYKLYRKKAKEHEKDPSAINDKLLQLNQSGYSPLICHQVLETSCHLHP